MVATASTETSVELGWLLAATASTELSALGDVGDGMAFLNVDEIPMKESHTIERRKNIGCFVRVFQTLK